MVKERANQAMHLCEAIDLSIVGTTDGTSRGTTNVGYPRVKALRVECVAEGALAKVLKLTKDRLLCN